MNATENPWWARIELGDTGYQIDPYITFIETSAKGVALMWTLDEDQNAIVVYLTPREVKKVLKQASEGGGLLETVRADLGDNDALLWRRNSGIEPFEIPRDVSEREFIDAVYQAIDRRREAPRAVIADMNIRLVRQVERKLSRREPVPSI